MDNWKLICVAGTIVAVPMAYFLFLLRKQKRLESTKLDDSYDYIIIGGGSAGCVLAARLSEDPTKKVLLLEAGIESFLLSTIPAAATDLRFTEIDWAYQTEPGKKTNGRVGNWPRGKMLGGCSAINNMLFVRGDKNEYDNWAANGCDGWDYQSVLPYFKKFENYEKATTSLRGTSGPMSITLLRDPRPITKMWINACHKYGQQNPSSGLFYNEDYNGEISTGVGPTQASIRNGSRADTFSTFLRPHLGRKNLTIRTKTHVNKIMIDKNNRAFAVDIGDKIISATTEIILSAGAIGSPQILMLSGIGPKDDLEKLGIRVIKDLPVGKNLQDHIFVPEPYECSKPITLAESLVLRPMPILNYLFRKRGPLTSTIVEAMAFLRTEPSLKVPDLQFHFAPAGLSPKLAKIFNMKHVENTYGVSNLVTLLKPKSVGRLYLKSKNPLDKPVIEANYLDVEADMDVLVKGLKMSRKIWEEIDIVTPTKIKEIPHPWESDEYLRELVRDYVMTVYHPVGTCKMGREEDETCVVNSKLQVKGISNLRVVDASVMPEVPPANTNAPTIMIAEKAADMIKNNV